MGGWKGGWGVGQTRRRTHSFLPSVSLRLAWVPVAEATSWHVHLLNYFMGRTRAPAANRASCILDGNWLRRAGLEGWSLLHFKFIFLDTHYHSPGHYGFWRVKVKKLKPILGTGRERRDDSRKKRGLKYIQKVHNRIPIVRLRQYKHTW